MDGHVIDYLQDITLLRVDLIFLNWDALPVHQPAVHKMIPEPYGASCC